MAKHEPKQYYDEKGNLIIKPYRLKDLAAIFDINAQTMKRWINKYPDELGNKDGKYYSVRQIDFLIEKFGLPRKVCVEMIMQVSQQAA
jgi:hypothetical protein